MLEIRCTVKYMKYMTKPDFCICENKGAYQLCRNCAAEQRLCFRNTDRQLPLLFKSKISSLLLSSLTVQPGLCRTWSETPKTGFLTTRLLYDKHVFNAINLMIFYLSIRVLRFEIPSVYSEGDTYEVHVHYSAYCSMPSKSHCQRQNDLSFRTISNSKIYN